MGLDCGLAMPGPADFNLVRYVDGQQFTSFKRIFSVENCYLGAILTVEVLTYYTDRSSSASVLINGVDVAPVAPRPFATYGDAMQLLEVFIKETYLINRGAPGATRTGWQELEIRPSSPADALLVGNWHVLFYR
jgi:hypothetical protein